LLPEATERRVSIFTHFAEYISVSKSNGSASLPVSKMQPKANVFKEKGKGLFSGQTRHY